MTALDELVGMHVLFLNWRDAAHPQAGGAEAYCQEIARRWVDAGVHVTLFASAVPNGAPREVVDGVRVCREGGVFGVYTAAAMHLRKNRRKYDAVVDCQNGIPFFSPLVTGPWFPTVCVIHHVHQEQFDDRFGWPLNVVGRVLEKQMSRLVYRGHPIVAVSPSTREEVRRRLRFTNPLYVVPNGAPRRAPRLSPVTAAPTIAVVNRLVPHKRIELLLEAIPAVSARWPNLHVDVVGDGVQYRWLRDLADALGVGQTVEFHGRVSEERKCELVARAWLTVVPSRAEGWGLTVVEANSVGTPALAFDVPGLRDAIEHGHNGWLLEAETDLAGGIDRALGELADPAVAARMARHCLAWAGQFSWDESAVRLAEVVAAEVRRVRGRQRSRRSTSDLAVVARFVAEDADALERLLTMSLRLTDTWIRRENVFGLLLHGCDEARALKMLQRVGVEEATVTLASRWDVVHRFNRGFSRPYPGMAGIEDVLGSAGVGDMVIPIRARVAPRAALASADHSN